MAGRTSSGLSISSTVNGDTDWIAGDCIATDTLLISGNDVSADVVPPDCNCSVVDSVGFRVYVAIGADLFVAVRTSTGKNRKFTCKFDVHLGCERVRMGVKLNDENICTKR